MAEIGDKMRFIPHAFVQYKQPEARLAELHVTGTVTQVHRAHRWVRVEYRMPGVAWPCYECFKF